MTLGRLLLTFRGRIPRSTFWLTGLSLGLLFVFLLSSFESIFGRTSSLLLYPPFFWALSAIIAKRLHDRGQSLFWLLILLIPLIGPIWLFIGLGLLRGTRGENQYGKDPLDVQRDYMTVGS